MRERFTNRIVWFIGVVSRRPLVVKRHHFETDPLPRVGFSVGLGPEWGLSVRKRGKRGAFLGVFRPFSGWIWGAFGGVFGLCFERSSFVLFELLRFVPLNLLFWRILGVAGMVGRLAAGFFCGSFIRD